MFCVERDHIGSPPGTPYAFLEAMRIEFTCPGQPQPPGGTTIIIGVFVFFDPSGVITDVKTGNPVVSATVTLYRVPNALPDRAGQPGDCRTVDTRGGDNWSKLPPASLASGVFIDPILEAINATQQISPTVNPQITGSDGRYAWDVAEGCWFVQVEAEGYSPLVSPVVGVPPEVTDLNLALSLERASDTKVYLPLLQQ